MGGPHVASAGSHECDAAGHTFLSPAPPSHMFAVMAASFYARPNIVPAAALLGMWQIPCACWQAAAAADLNKCRHAATGCAFQRKHHSCLVSTPAADELARWAQAMHLFPSAAHAKTTALWPSKWET